MHLVSGKVKAKLLLGLSLYLLFGDGRLAENIKVHGLIHPICVAQRDEGYVIISGHRRVRARSDLVLALIELVRTRLEEDVLSSVSLDRAVDEIVSGKADPYTLARRLFGRWRESAEAG
ncbi:MAG: ParB N-terminal domain-containing protein, partial [Chloroflexi bacterium]|nr:ParB N-terminal domain-containing protein [Chloroflexota bacterium]